MTKMVGQMPGPDDRGEHEQADIGGKVMARSTTRMAAASIRRPPNAASAPIAKPMMGEIETAPMAAE